MQKITASVTSDYGGPDLSVEWQVRPASELARLAPSWNALNAAGPDSPLLDAEFFGLALEFFGRGDELLATCGADDALQAATLVRSSGRGRWSTFQPAQAPMGPWLARPGDPPYASLSGLASVLPGLTFLTGITQLDPEVYARPDAASGLATLDYIDTAALPIAGSFDDYWARRGKNLRQNLRRQRNRLQREAVETKLVAVQRPDPIAAAVDDYGRLESRGWKADQGTALHPENAQGQFYRALFEAYGRRGEAIVYQYYYGDSLVACDLCLHRNGVIVVLKTTHDETQKTSSPTMLMRQQVLQQLFENGGFGRMEFYGKLMDWHTKWTSSVRRMYHVNAWRWPWLDRFAARLRARHQGATVD